MKGVLQTVKIHTAIQEKPFFSFFSSLFMLAWLWSNCLLYALHWKLSHSLGTVGIIIMLAWHFSNCFVYTLHCKLSSSLGTVRITIPSLDSDYMPHVPCDSTNLIVPILASVTFSPWDSIQHLSILSLPHSTVVPSNHNSSYL